MKNKEIFREISIDEVMYLINYLNLLISTEEQVLKSSFYEVRCRTRRNIINLKKTKAILFNYKQILEDEELWK